ncbi:CHAD domain-containing protein [Salipiger bermudensis]|uniref:CHAD domain-containing protein n=1 Tax=Salipiger bermudensis TaxID=344736 RepID=UPI001CD6C6AD|nr:CHAD domain-containing protein [Salipiger bermudensis]MCA0962031.1 CHAD domain-containing protein [Salipiger bermudensis]
MPEILTITTGGDLRTLLRDADLGKLHLSLDEADGGSAFTLLDTFDAQVAAAELLLLLTEDGLHLLGGAAPLVQAHAEPDFLARMPAGPVTKRLSGIVSPLRTLMSVAGGTLSRQGLRVLDDNEKTHLRGTLHVLDAGKGRTVSVSDLTPLRGYDKTLRKVGSALSGRAGKGKVNTMLEASAVLRGEDPALIGKTRVVMSADEKAFKAANDIIRAQLVAARRQEDGIRADLDSEFLHEYRVALRRVRSVISLFKGVYDDKQTADLKARFGAIMARTGRLRDLDVYLIEREAYLALVPEGFRPGIGKLFDMFAAQRDVEHAKLTAYLDSKAYQKEMAKLEALFDKTKALSKGPEAKRHALDYAKALIWKRYRKVCKIARDIDDATPDAQVHELRIECKKLRYLMEFFAPLFGDAEVRKLIKALKGLQDNLGNFNDYSVQQAALQAQAEALVGGTAADTVEIASGLGALVTVLHQKQLEERARVAASFAAFDSAETQAQFRSLFKPGGEAKP